MYQSKPPQIILLMTQYVEPETVSMESGVDMEQVVMNVLYMSVFHYISYNRGLDNEQRNVK